jgi:hypothetical protein
MQSEIKKSINSILFERLTSPLYGTLIISWLIWNWKIIYLTLFVDSEENYEEIEIKTKEKIELENFEGIIKYFGGGTYKSFEYVAYLDLKKFAIMSIISSRSESELNNNYSNFKELLKSIKVLNIEIQNE